MLKQLEEIKVIIEIFLDIKWRFSMKKVIFAALLCMAIFTACSDNNSSEYPEKETVQNTTTAVASSTTTVAKTTVITTAVTTTATTVTTATTTVKTTTAAVSTTTKASPQPISETSETAPPFGDLHGAYVCIGGIEVYPSVYVMTKDDVSELADFFNSEIWTEESMDDYVPPTGSMGMTYYILKDGKYSSYGDLSSIYYSDGVKRHFRKTPKNGDYSNRLSASDFLYRSGGSRIVGTHINELSGECTDQEYWDLIWNDVLPWIEENGY